MKIWVLRVRITNSVVSIYKSFSPITAVQNCPNETLRLVDGPLESAGRVEICVHGVWGTVCGGDWDSTQAKVVCRQLGYNVNTGGGEFIH